MCPQKGGFSEQRQDGFGGAIQVTNNVMFGLGEEREGCGLIEEQASLAASFIEGG
jgi:hypothetical protein